MDTEPTVEPDPTSVEVGEEDLTGMVLSERYRLIERVGVGGMGAVYKAEHVRMHKVMAVKVLHPELTIVDEVLKRFEREAQAAANIDHPNVCAATDFSRDETGHFYLVMEFLEGKTLDEVIYEEGALEPGRAVSIATQICAALARAHEMGIIHRDLKPENVGLVEREGEPELVKVLDFGIARVPPPDEGAEAQTLTRAGYVMGTPAYLSPEQASGGEVDHRADLYSLGVMLFEMLCGRRPFESASTVELIGMHVTRPPPPLSRKLPDGVRVPRRLEQLVARLLAKEARQRPESARVVKEELEQIAVRLDPKRSTDAVAALARGAASRAVEGLEAVGERVAPVLADVRGAAPDAIPLLKRLPRWIWIVVVANLLLGTLVVAAVWSSLTSDEALTAEPRVEAPQGAPTQGAGAAPGPRGAPSTKALSALERMRARPDVAAALAKRETHGAATVARELGVLYRQQNSPELAYLLAQAESVAGDDRAALLHTQAALAGDASLAQDAQMRRWVFSKLGSRQSPLAAKIAERHYLPEHAAELEDLCCSEERQSGRRRAQALVVKTGGLDRVAPWCRLVIELETASGCSARRTIVRQMAELGDARVVPALRNLEVRRGRRGIFRRRRSVNTCLREDLRRALRTLGGESPDAGNAP